MDEGGGAGWLAWASEGASYGAETPPCAPPEGASGAFPRAGVLPSVEVELDADVAVERACLCTVLLVRRLRVTGVVAAGGLLGQQ